MTNAILLSTPLTLSIAGSPAEPTSAGNSTGTTPSGGSFNPPYALPAPGTKVAIPTAGRNVANDIRPAAHSPGSWQYSLFQSYGGGSFSADYSAAGAYVLAGTGGHGAPPCFGGAIFDFTTGRWTYLPNANGFDESRVEDVDRRQHTNGWPYLELTAVKSGQMPSPSHRYTLQVSPPKSVVGGPKGAIIATLGAAQTREGWDSPQSHKFDLATGLWTRAAGNLITDVSQRSPYTDSSAAYDPSTQRVYVSLHFPTDDRLPCLDLTDGMWKSAGRFALPGTNSVARSIWVDDRRRLLLYLLDNTQLWALSLDRISAGPVRLSTSGSVPNTSRRWEEYPVADGGDGCFYTLTGSGPAYGDGPPPLAASQELLKLAPPSGGSPLTGTWAFSTVPIRGGITAQYVTDPSSGAQHESRFFYVPALRCFAWIPNGSGAVELIKP
jgi:hypothetical protein